MPQMESVDIPAPHGLLEGLLRIDNEALIGAPSLAAVVCHPHPLGAGTMHNKVVFTMARALNNASIPALRFNFRGVGRSTGTYDHGQGETEDVHVALDWMASRYPGVPLLLAGFSFGSWVGLPVGCADDRVVRLIGVGVPVGTLKVAGLNLCDKPKLIVQGSDDEYGPQDDVQRWFSQVAEPKTLHIVNDADHFFANHLNELSILITQWVQQ